MFLAAKLEKMPRLLGAFLVTKIQLAAMSRVDVPERERKDFYLYVDEFQHFATESFANILSEARKYHLSLIMAHQYIKQMEEPVRDAVFGNVGTIVSFRVGAEDAEYLEKWFSPDFLLEDIVNLGKFNVYMKLMIDGVSSKGFSATMIPPFAKLEKSSRGEIIEYSRRHYATSREDVDKNITEWAGILEEEEKEAHRAASSQGSKWSVQNRSGGYSSGSGQMQRPDYGRFPQRFKDNSNRPMTYGESFRQAPSSAKASADRQGEPSRTVHSEPSRTVHSEPSRTAQRSYDRAIDDGESRRVIEERQSSQERPFLRSVQYSKFNKTSTQDSKELKTLGWEKQENKTANIKSQSKNHPAERQPLKMSSRPISQFSKLNQSSGDSLDQLLKEEPVNFQGKKIKHKEARKERQKVEVDTDDLRKALLDAIGGGEN